MVIGAGVGAVVVVAAATVTATGMAGARTADRHSWVVKQESCMIPKRVATVSSGGATHPLIRGVDREFLKMIPSQFVHRGVQTAVGEDSASPGAEDQKRADKILAMQKILSICLMTPRYPKIRPYQPPPIFPASWTTRSVSVIWRFPTSLTTSR